MKVLLVQRLHCFGALIPGKSGVCKEVVAGLKRLGS